VTTALDVYGHITLRKRINTPWHAECSCRSCNEASDKHDHHHLAVEELTPDQLTAVKGGTEGNGGNEAMQREIARLGTNLNGVRTDVGGARPPP
jgi:hypothetical protein